DPERFLAWAEGEPWLLGRPGLLWAARLLPLVALGSIVAAAAGAVPASLAALVLVVNLIVSRVLGTRIDPRLDEVAAGADELTAYAGALAVAEEGRFAAPRLAGLAADLGTDRAAGALPASRAMARLARRIEIADARHGSFHVFTQALLLWDVHALWLLERWQAGPGRRARRWLGALGELEALAALAALAHDEPEWTFPRIVEEGAPTLAARALAHPLLPAGSRVANDVALGPPGSFLLLTGSNMSGKSTLLRAIGANVVLAQAGGPVCAAELALPPVVLGTSVVVEDSLGDGVSFFMAELLRLKQVVDLAHAAPAAGRTLLFLLDEVLRGTNNRERREALRRVIAHLTASGAIGAVSTHDLELGDLPEIAAAAVPVHFRETVHPPGTPGPPMSFDYRLRPGPATTTNALRLLEMVGLGGGAP
ncbi:MAG TPA: MutS family DNA mismatch repair protein, partial [Thermoanaerobaculia bacterium]|nr:MutS family DNA mismatch repair protein [Thermoanaerobaculia bacterium]